MGGEVRIGGGWDLYHLTDRVVELRKPDYLYHLMTGRPGFVRVRIDPIMTRQDAVELAIRMAQKNDEVLAERAAKQMLPSKAALADYTGKQVRLQRAFASPEDPEVIGVKRA